AAEQQLMTELLNSYGKTWHTWHTGRHDLGGGQDLPLGGPMLMWSFNRDGEGDPALETHRAEAMGIDTAGGRRRRQELQARARRRARALRAVAEPRGGVDARREGCPGTAALPGVEETEQATRARAAGPASSTPRPADGEEHA